MKKIMIRYDQKDSHISIFMKTGLLTLNYSADLVVTPCGELTEQMSALI